jgi:hypothetical protein
MTGTDQLLAVAREYAHLKEMELSTVSWRVFGDTKKLGAMEAGADIQTKRFERAMLWFSKNWPETASWPADIVRPAASPLPRRPEEKVATS